VGKKASSTSTISGAERVSLSVALQRRLTGKIKPGAAIDDMNAAVIREDSYLYLGETLIDSGWFANSARIKFVNGVITVWPFGGSIGWPPEPPERWSIVDASAKPANTESERSPVQEIIRQFAVDEFGSNWGKVPTPAIEKAAKKSEDFKKRAPAFPPHSIARSGVKPISQT